MIISVVYSRGKSPNYQMTHYGCPDECHTQKGPACDEHRDLGNNTQYFAALSTDFNYRKYCGDYVVLMLTNGSKNMVKAEIVDSCGSCEKYHVDLSNLAFSALETDKHKGVGNIIWAIYSSSGKRLDGPYENNARNAAKKHKLPTSRSFIDAFDINAKKLASSSHNTRKFDSSLGFAEKKPTTTTKAAITTTKAALEVTEVASLNTTTEQIPENKTLPNVNPIPVPKPEKSEEGIEIHEAVKEGNEGEIKNDEKSNYTVGVITAVGGSVLGAAGVGLLFMKKKNPTQYEDLKQKFPEAFSNVKRGLSRSATKLKRRMTKKTERPTIPSEFIYNAPKELITF